MPGREMRLAQTFIELADTLVKDFDVVDLFATLGERSVELFGAAAAGVLLADTRGALQLVSATSEAMEKVELWQIQCNEGPCVDCYATREPVLIEDLAATTDRWPQLLPVALDAGFRSAHALPLRLRDRVIGAFNLFGAAPGRMGPDDTAAAQALADAATLGVIHHRAARDAQALTDQLQLALNSRIAIEQAKGILAAQAGLTMTEAFSQLRGYARANQRRLSDLAEDIVAGRLDGAALAT